MSSCLVCSNKEARPSIYGGYRYREKEYTLMKCLVCGFIYLDPLPSNETLKQIYSGDEYFNNYSIDTDGNFRNYTEGISDNSFENSKVIELIKKFNGNGKRLLDVGCAAGHFLMAAKRAGYSAFGIEPNPKMADFAKEKLAAEIYQGQLEDDPFESDYFHIIYASDVLEHLQDLQKGVMIFKKILKHDGILVISQPLMYNRSLFNLFQTANMWCKRDRYSANPPSHLWEFNAHTLSKFLEKNGFEILYYSLFERKAKPLSFGSNQNKKNLLGYYIKNISSYLSNSFMTNMFRMGDRAIAVCRHKEY